MMWWGNNNGNTSGTMMMGVVMLVFLAVAVAVTVWVLRAVRGNSLQPRVTEGTDGPHHDKSTAYDDPEQVLARRFAAGEIDEAQFDRSRAVLRRDAPR